MNRKMIIAIVASAFIALFEYFVLLLFWGGDGTFTFFATPIAFIIYLMLQFILLKHFHNLIIFKNIIKFSMVLLTPLLSMGTVWLIAKIIGINITIL